MGLVAGFGLGIHYAQPKGGVAAVKPTVAEAPAAALVNLNGPPTATDLQDYQRARRLVLHENPQLVAEYKEIVDEMNKHQEDIEAAMVKCDPKVAPIVAKLAAMRERSMAQALSANTVR